MNAPLDIKLLEESLWDEREAELGDALENHPRAHFVTLKCGCKWHRFINTDDGCSTYWDTEWDSCERHEGL